MKNLFKQLEAKKESMSTTNEERVKTTSGEAPHCPKCDATLDGAAALDGPNRPKPDDVSLCFYCGAVCQFQEDLSMRELNVEMEKQLPEEVQIEIAQIRLMIRNFRKETK